MRERGARRDGWRVAAHSAATLGGLGPAQPAEFSPPCAPCRARFTSGTMNRRPVDDEVLRRLIREAGGGVRVRDLAGRTGTATAVRGGLAVVTYPDGGVERLDPAWLTWAGTPMRPTGREDGL